MAKPESGRQILKKLKRNPRPRPAGWGPVSAVIATLTIYFGSQIIAAYIIVQYLILRGTSRENVVSAVDDSVRLQFFFILFAEAAVLLFLWIFMRWRGISWPRIGVKKPTVKNMAYAIPGYVMYFIAILIVFIFVKQFVPNIDINQSQQVGFDNAAGGGSLALVFAALVILPAVTEEIMVRGFLYGGLRNKLPFLQAAVLTSVIFGLAHLQLGDGKSPVWIAAVDTFTLSMVLVWLREKTGNIWAGVIVHMLKNSMAFLALFIWSS
ncbi:MAG TPA: CPBP family intramembrane glutamic endopeptidase [Candidatus Saccharimonadales bacterium]|nr:CPBP family intramembrane glutamic endopeptidase [Candidatus Saccharimonadales bacterium]